MILTTCMGRVPFLREALESWRELSPFPILVVAYGCSETVEFVRGLMDPRVWICSVDAPGGYFNKCRALNAGLRVLANARRSRALLLDADTVLTRELSELTHARETMTIVEPSPSTGELTGVLSVNTHMLLAAGGADESMHGYGAEDLDLRMRAYLNGVRRVELFPDGLFRALPHDDGLRVANYEVKNLEWSAFENLSRLGDTLSRITDLASLQNDPLIPVLLAAAVRSAR